MKRDHKRAAARRRDVLKLAGLGAAAGAAAVAATRPAAAAGEASAQRTGYRETAHVRKVYELARF